ncbi:PH, RCC1 and FYVE domains-containing protein 1 isoform X2 [Magnolia sinica]|uniref:PH, RCC1 and FYVE domains-containing protein 1 isoform X2 n=1 Tax=Magnolia sinica TaxID=86752 RepID=UPI002659C43F|nr:PH, RCC1 and FYVE domains-containing protein 1 isoform X2 [Magnolia sinica]
MDEKFISRTPPLPLDRGIEKAIVALKKGAHLLKYGRRGKPKFCPFRLSTDEKVLIWYSGKEEKLLKLNSVTKIIPGQRTVNFQRQLQPEKECQSFSLVYANGERSLDLVRSLCGSPRPLAERGISDGLLYSSDSLYSSGPRSSSNEQTVMDVIPPSPNSQNGYFQEKVRESYPDNGYRMSLPSAFSSSNHWPPSTGKDDVLRDVLMWGEGIGGILGGGLDRSTSYDTRSDALLPKLLESTSMLDVRNISCGGKHAALVTRQGEVFCWGEEKGGRLGHKINMDVSLPKIVESLTDVHVESIACGEYHTCALTLSGELYTWGECGHVDGHLGDGSNRSWWLPRRVAGPFDGICISGVACGEWHTAVVSSSGQLFTYGDGMFGVLGHGNLESTSQPREVKSLRGLRVKSVACGPWHTAAIVEIMVDRFKGNSPGGKLFTWGDGDKGRLGHLDKEKKLLPTCVASLVDHDFIQVSCGRMLTVALTVTGMVCTMGSAVHGQLGNPLAEDKSVAIVEGNLKGEFVKEISSGSYHVSVLTTKGSVYAWGMGANGRLGLGDIEDRSSPSLVEALKDRQVLSIVCGSSFTAAICLHKSISSSDQSVCSGCRMLFGFTRKKHNCYNCGLVFCHACSSKKAMNASLAPNKSKQYRVCDPCFAQLRNHVDSRLRQEAPSPRPPLATRKPSSNPKVEREEPTSARSHIFSPKLSIHEEIKCTDGSNQQSLDPVSPLLSTPPRWGQVACPPLFNTSDRENSMMFVPPPREELSAVSPAYGHKSPPKLRSMTPIAMTLEQGSTESDKMLKEEVQRLRAEARSLVKQCQMRSEKLEQYQQRIEDTWSLAREEVTKCKAAKEVIKVLTTRLNAMSEKFSSGREPSSMRSIAEKVDLHQPQITPVCAESLEFDDMRSMFGSMHLSSDVRILKNRQMNDLCSPPLPSCDKLTSMHVRDGHHGHTKSVDNSLVARTITRQNRTRDHHHGHTKSVDDSLVARTDTGQNGMRDHHHGHTKSVDDSLVAKMDTGQNGMNALKADWVEQDDPGVYITFMTLPCGQKGLKRVRFSRKRFTQKEAELWWEENQLRVYQKYDIEGIVSSSTNRMSS